MPVCRKKPYERAFFDNIDLARGPKKSPAILATHRRLLRRHRMKREFADALPVVGAKR